jgi:diguanylate cyclase (GGDEF)-like protein/hemerythrin-like metal-binding protein
MPDYFKSFNDCYGHVTGDGCLQQIAQMMADYAGRPADLTARYGGEEFACILPETDHYGALAVAENIRQGIMALDIPHHESRVATCVTASLGVVTVLCCGEESPVALVAQADKLLYRAKSSGRNRVESLRPLPAEKDLKGNVVQLVWKEAFCCGNQLIDAQHHSLFGRANELLAAVLSARPSSPAITALISRLLDEVSQHFHDEELILTTVGFSGIDQHSAEHAQLLTRGRQLAEEFQTSTLRMGDLLHFLAYDMVLCHMLETDQDFFGFLTEADAAAVAGEKDR